MMKIFSVQIQYRTPAGELEDPWIEVQAQRKMDARKAALTEAIQRSNGKGALVRQIFLKTP